MFEKNISSREIDLGQCIGAPLGFDEKLSEIFSFEKNLAVNQGPIAETFKNRKLCIQIM